MSPLPEICFAVCRNPAVAVGLPMLLGFGSNLVAGEMRHERTGAPVKTVCPPHPMYTYVNMAIYGLAGYASHLAVKAFDAAPTPGTTENASNALIMYYAGLALNLLWTPLFVGGNQPTAALVDSALTTATAIAFTAKMSELPFTGTSPVIYLLPVCGWLGYNTYLNATAVLSQQKCTKPQ